MKQHTSISKIFTDQNEYIQGLNNLAFNYTVQSEQSNAFHLSRVHVVNDSIITFSDHEASYGEFFQSDLQKKYLGIRFLNSGYEQIGDNINSTQLSQNDCLIFEPSEHSFYQRHCRTQGINVFIPLDKIQKNCIVQNGIKTIKANCSHGMGAVLKTQLFAIEKEMPHFDQYSMNYMISKSIDSLSDWISRCYDSLYGDKKTTEFQKITNFIDSHLLDSQFSLTFVADHFNVTSRTIQNLFTQKNLQFSNYVLEKRLSSSINDIVNTKLNITDIAYKWRFCDAAYYCRVFKRSYSLSPLQYRQKATQAKI